MRSWLPPGPKTGKDGGNSKDRPWRLAIDSRIIALLKPPQRNRSSRRVVAGDSDGDGAEG